jgi:probable F420-dependent oxidoreductase
VTANLKVRIGIGLGVGRMVDDRAAMTRICRSVEDHGFDSLWLSEVMASPAPDPVTAAAFAAAVTERIKLGTSVLVGPGRPPVLLAKTIATLDLLSGHRFLPILGLGTADPAEQQSFDVARAARGPVLEETVPLLRRLWTEDAVTHRGGYFRLDAVRLGVRPARGLPVWLGGRAESELRRAGRLGDGWLASFATPAEVEHGVSVVQQSAADAGRAIDDDHFGVLLLYSLRDVSVRTAEFLAWRRPDLAPPEVLPVGGPRIRERLLEHIAAGASKFILVPAEQPADWPAELAELAEAVLGLQTKQASDRLTGVTT